MTLMRPIGSAARDHGRRLQAQLLRLLGDEWEVVSSRSRDWASATFTGARHTLLLSLPHMLGKDDVDRLSQKVAGHEFTLTRAFVNDITLDRCTAMQAGHTRIIVELLVIEDR